MNINKNIHLPNNKLFAILIILQFFLFSACTQKAEPANDTGASPFVDRVFRDTSDFYFVDFNQIDKKISTSSPIGVFDSGTGGLTVLEAILNFDNFDFASNNYHEDGDGIKDFKNERFIYFGDQANMPYGNYPAMDKTTFLKELILRDALFLLGNKRYEAAEDTIWQNDKESVKIIVVACNTATAYGKEDIQKMLSEAGSDIPVIGVIDAGVRGAFSTFNTEENGTAAVIATAGTVSSDGYLNTFVSQKSKLNYKGEFEFVQQSGYGIAEAIDEEPSFIDRKATKIRADYNGPSMTNEKYKIIEELLPVYNFDTTGNALLMEKKNGRLTEIQLNSAENYIRYHLVNLSEQLRQNKVKSPLKTLILGCTHYPYYTSFFQSTLNELYNLKLKGKYVYREFLNDSIILIDPAENTAREVHKFLYENELDSDKKNNINEFYISVPDLLSENIQIDSSKSFTYGYKYNRDVNHFYDTKQVPMSSKTVNQDVLLRIQNQMPEIYEMIMKQ